MSFFWNLFIFLGVKYEEIVNAFVRHYHSSCDIRLCQVFVTSSVTQDVLVCWRRILYINAGQRTV